jgi:hypothetical protein
MRREPHVRFCERAAVKLHRATHRVITCTSATEARVALEAASRVLKELGVNINPQKTRIVHVRHGFEFLGYKIKRGGRPMRLPTSKIRTRARPGTKSELFRDFLPLLNSVLVTLPRNDRLVSQIVSLERRVSPVGKDTITHPPNGHDDLANAVAGAASLSQYPGYDISGAWVSGPEKPKDDPKEREERVRKLIELLKRGEKVPF